MAPGEAALVSKLFSGGDSITLKQSIPALVDMNVARDFTSSAETGTIPPIGPISYGWIASDLNPDGTVSFHLDCNQAKGTWSAEPAGDG